MMYHYTVHGQSQGDKHVLLLHGFPDDGLLWQPQVCTIDAVDDDLTACVLYTAPLRQQVHALVNAGYCAIVPDMLGMLGVVVVDHHHHRGMSRHPILQGAVAPPSQLMHSHTSSV